jgi:fructose-1,6-bisphosphatase I
MHDPSGLDQHLETWAAASAPRRAVASAVLALAGSCRDIAALVAAGPLAANLALSQTKRGGGDLETELESRAYDLLLKALEQAPVAAVATEDMDAPAPLTYGAPILAALAPLDGAANIKGNGPIGTIFSLLPAPAGAIGIESAAFLQPGRQQIAGGYVIYGPQTVLVLSLGAGTDIFTLDRESGGFVRTGAHLHVAARALEIAINASNYRHWDMPVRTWFDDCLAGEDGPRAENCNLRWTGSLLAEAHRILLRGGVYFYPGDARHGYRNGRLRLLYQANPIAFLMEQAGGRASTGCERVLDRTPRLLHERVPLVFGARDEIERIERYQLDHAPKAETSPLFARRGLFVQ